MVKLPGAVAAACLLLHPLASGAQAQEEMETVLVTGELPGPGLWKVSRDGHVLWVFGAIGGVPDTIAWRTQELEARIAESREVLYPGWPAVKLDVSVFQALSLVPLAFKAAKNPEGVKLKDVLDTEDYARWLQLKQKYLGDDDDIEKYRPMVAEEKLRNARDKIRQKPFKGLKFTWVDEVVRKLAKKHDVRIHTLPAVEREIKVEKPRAILKAARDLDFAEGECVGRNLERIEKEDALAVQAFDVALINAWARGDIAGLRAQPPPDPALQPEDCLTAALNAAIKREDADLPKEVRRGFDLFQQLDELQKQAGVESERNWIEAADAALRANTSTVAVLPMNVVLNPWIYMAKLKEKGCVVEGPPGSEPATENAGPSSMERAGVVESGKAGGSN
jgi:hypothetical protein